MLDLETARRTAVTQYGRFADMVDGLDPDELDRPTRLAGWQVRDLVAHVAWGIGMEADALRRMRAGDPGPAEGPSIDATTDAAELATRMRADGSALAEGLAGLAADDLERPVVLPTSTVPAVFAATVFAFEASLHASDLAEALGHPDALDADALTACVAFTGPFLQFAGAAGEAADDGTSYELAGTALRLHLLRDDGRWTVAPSGVGDAGGVRFSADDEPLVLFVHGRRSLAGPGLAVTGDPAVAGRFKSHFPGP